MRFEWDEEKDRINQQKHGICFETAMMVFISKTGNTVRKERLL